MFKKFLFMIPIILLIIGCTSPHDDPGTPGVKKGNLVINIENEVNGRTLEPAIDMSIATYTITGSGPNAESFSAENITQSVFSKTDLKIGDWVIVVDAYNGAGINIASGSTNVVITKGQTAAATVTVVPLDGPGTFSLTMTWPPNEISDPVVEVVISTQGGVINERVLTGITNASMDATLDAGYYTINIQLLDGTDAVWGAMEALRIVSDEPTIANFSLSVDDINSVNTGALALTIDPDLQSPIGIVFEGNLPSINEGDEMTVTAVTSEVCDTQQWYLNGVGIPDATRDVITVGAELTPGSYRLDYVVGKEAVISASAVFFTVVEKQLEITGQYYGTSNGNQYIFTIDDNQAYWDYTDPAMDDMSANVVTYDNSDDYCVLFWTAHPISIYQYQKVTWSAPDPAYLVCDTYNAFAAFQDALDDTVIAYPDQIIYREPQQLNGLSYFSMNSYLPIIENATWTDNNGNTTQVMDVDTTSDTFAIMNVGEATSYFTGYIDKDATGYYVSYNGFSGPWFLPVMYTIGYKPIIYDDTALTPGLSWSDTGNSNGYTYNLTITVESIGQSLTTPGGQTYADCAHIKVVFDFPGGYDQNPQIVEYNNYFSKGIGCVQSERRYSDNTTTSYYITSYTMP